MKGMQELKNSISRCSCGGKGRIGASPGGGWGVICNSCLSVVGPYKASDFEHYRYAQEEAVKEWNRQNEQI